MPKRRTISTLRCMCPCVKKAIMLFLHSLQWIYSSRKAPTTAKCLSMANSMFFDADADAVMFTTINGWEKQSGLNYIKVDIKYTLKSAKTNEILFERNGELTVDFTSGNNGLLGMVLDMVNTAITDKIVAARRCNYFILRDLPVGKYSVNFDKDQDTPAGSKDFKGRVSY